MAIGSLTDLQKDIIIGSLLGDGHISYYAPSNNGRFTLRMKYKPYVDYICNELNIKRESNLHITKLNNKLYFSYNNYSNYNRLFGEWSENWYMPRELALDLYQFHYNLRYGRIKVIPFGSQFYRLSPIVVYHWFIQDGLTNPKGVGLSTECFPIIQIEQLKIDLENIIGLKASINRNTGCIWIHTRNNINKFFNYIGQCKHSDYNYKWAAYNYSNEPKYNISHDKMEQKIINFKKYFNTLNRTSYGQLYNEYVIQQLSLRTIANKYNVDKKTVKRWLKDYNITIRTKAESYKVRHNTYGR